MKIGDVELFLVSDGLQYADGGGMFGLVPKVMWEKKHPADDLNRVAVRMNCLLIKDGNHRIVVDTGYGSKMPERTRTLWGIVQTGELPQGLRELGVELPQVDLVINTHLHADHCGGNTVRKGSELLLAFPEATYIVQEREWQDANSPNERTRATYLPENYLPVRDAERLELVEGDTQITPHVRCLSTSGHAPGHQSVLIESQGEKALYIGDMASFAVHIERLPWVPAYDLDPMRTIDERREYQRWAVEQHVLLIFPHDPEIGMGYLHAESGRFWVEPAE